MNCKRAKCALRYLMTAVPLLRRRWPAVTPLLNRSSSVWCLCPTGYQKGATVPQLCPQQMHLARLVPPGPSAAAPRPKPRLLRRRPGPSHPSPGARLSSRSHLRRRGGSSENSLLLGDVQTRLCPVHKIGAKCLLTRSPWRLTGTAVLEFPRAFYM